MTIAVTGATGQLGRLVIDKLKAKAGEAIVALVRSPANAQRLGVAVREADYARPATLKSALAGMGIVGTVYNLATLTFATPNSPGALIETLHRPMRKVGHDHRRHRSHRPARPSCH